VTAAKAVYKLSNEELGDEVADLQEVSGEGVNFPFLRILSGTQ
jgi:hypothetical protein